MIKRVETKAQLKEFVHFPHKLYHNDSAYVPQLNIVQMNFLSSKNPFFKHSDAQYFLAYENGEVVGRIAAIVNRKHLEKYNDQTGFFGFFDVYDNPTISKLLLDQATEWLKKQQIKLVVGPENFTTNDSCGILVDGFQEPPVLMMPYNKQYYKKLLLDYGFQSLTELYQYRICSNEWGKLFYNQLLLLQERLKISGITVRFLNMKKLDGELKILRYLYNESNEDNWGFVPLTEQEFHYMAQGLKKIAERESLLIAEKDGQPIGYMISLPDFNMVFKKIRNGKLTIGGLYHLISWKKIVDKIRLMILGVLPEFRKKGVDGILYLHLYNYIKKRNLNYAEICYVMEQNSSVLQLLNHLQAERVKTYQLMRLYIH